MYHSLYGRQSWTVFHLGIMAPVVEQIVYSYIHVDRTYVCTIALGDNGSRIE